MTGACGLKSEKGNKRHVFHASATGNHPSTIAGFTLLVSRIDTIAPLHIRAR